MPSRSSKPKPGAKKHGTPDAENPEWTAKDFRQAKRAGEVLPEAFGKRPGTSRDYDFATLARKVVEQAIGEKLDGSPLDNPDEGKNPAAVALGKLGGAKGGAARAAALSPAKRKAIARKAAKARWGR